VISCSWPATPSTSNTRPSRVSTSPSPTWKTFTDATPIRDRSSN